MGTQVPPRHPLRQLFGTILVAPWEMCLQHMIFARLPQPTHILVCAIYLARTGIYMILKEV